MHFPWYKIDSESRATEQLYLQGDQKTTFCGTIDEIKGCFNFGHTVVTFNQDIIIFLIISFKRSKLGSTKLPGHL